MKSKNGGATFKNSVSKAMLDKGRPVKPHRSGGGVRAPNLKGVVVALPLPRFK